MAESPDDFRKRIGCYFLIVVWFATILPSIAAPWIVLSYFGPFYSVLSIIVVHAVWLALAGVPRAASGGKPSTWGWMLIVISTWPATIVDVVLIVIQLVKPIS